jgi:EAL domain-containing protein (putative c-di-GMP-specific phosphodiesterase class I)
MPTHGHVSINVSARQLLNDSIVAYVSKALRETGLGGEQLVLEITESALLEVTMTTKSVIHSLRRLGIRIALDDFGTGYGSLTHLKRLPVDMMKIDQSFVRNITSDKADTAICRSMIELASDLNLAVIVEGIETQAQLDTIAGLNAQTYQGYYLALPAAASETTQLLTQYVFDSDQHSA